MQQPRHHRGGAVPRVRHRQLPEAGMRHPVMAAAFRAKPLAGADEARQAIETLGHLPAGNLRDALVEHRPKLQPMGV